MAVLPLHPLNPTASVTVRTAIGGTMNLHVCPCATKRLASANYKIMEKYTGNVEEMLFGWSNGEWDGRGM